MLLDVSIPVEGKAVANLRAFDTGHYGVYAECMISSVLTPPRWDEGEVKLEGTPHMWGT